MATTQAQIQKAIDQIQDKRPIPEIDFTQHQLDNGYTISTQERVVKEVGNASGVSRTLWIVLTVISLLGASSGHDNPYRRPVLFENGPFEARRRVLEEPLLPRGPSVRRACTLHPGEGHRDPARGA